MLSDMVIINATIRDQRPLRIPASDRMCSVMLLGPGTHVTCYMLHAYMLYCNIVGNHASHGNDHYQFSSLCITEL